MHVAWKPGKLPRRPWWHLALGPVLAGLVWTLGPGDDPNVARMAAIAVWMAVWWVTEAVPIPVTSLLPLVLMPLCGVMSIREVGPNYGRPTIFLFLGGVVLALGLQASGVHKRIALGIVHFIGGQSRRLVLGFMLATALLSMWISNTATVMVLMPIGLSVLAAASERGTDERELAALGAAVMLGIAYAADIGGMATLVGTPPNLSYKEQLVRLFPGAPEPSFAQWTALALPVSVVFLGVGWVVLTRLVFKLPGDSLLGSRLAVDEMRAEMEPMSRDEWLTALIFGITALLWMTRKSIILGPLSLPGWGPLMPGSERGPFVDDAVVAVTMALLLFVIPSDSRPGERLMEWRLTDKLPWGMLLLFGGGFALAAGFKSSGLSHWVGEQFTQLSAVHPLVLIALVCVVLTFLTELTSNTATTEMVLPILAAAGVALGTDPRGLMIPATLSASCAFMMPVASPTQAIVFSSGWVPIKAMIRAGIWFNIIGVVLVVTAFALLSGPIMDISLDVLPAWAR